MLESNLRNSMSVFQRKETPKSYLTKKKIVQPMSILNTKFVYIYCALFLFERVIGGKKKRSIKCRKSFC